MSFLLGMLVMALICPLLAQLYRRVQWLLRLRAVAQQLQGESRAQAKARAGEWRDD